MNQFTYLTDFVTAIDQIVTEIFYMIWYPFQPFLFNGETKLLFGKTKHKELVSSESNKYSTQR